MLLSLLLKYINLVPRNKYSYASLFRTDLEKNIQAGAMQLRVASSQRVRQSSNQDSEGLQTCRVVTAEGTGNKLPRKQSGLITHFRFVRLICDT